MVFFGLSGLKTSGESGFSSEAAYQAVYVLSGEVRSDWDDFLSLFLQSLDDGQRQAFDAVAEQLLHSAWEDQKKDSGEELSALLDDAGENDREALLHRLLYCTYQVNGPKVSTSVKKSLAAVPEGERDTFCLALLSALLDGEAEVPQAAADALKKTDEAERPAMLLQLLYTKLTENGRVNSEDISALKKNIRDKGMQLTAFRMIALQEMNWFTQLVIGNGKTVVLAGILLALDALLLGLLMASGRNWHFDIKWIIILAIVDFLLLFQMLPLVYMLIKAFFPDSSFSLETVRRLYTYPLNLDALSNTIIAAFSTMVIGTLVFPLPLCADVYGSALCGGYGLAAPFKPQCGHHQSVDACSFAFTGYPRTHECLFSPGAHLGAHHLLLSLRLHHHQPCHGEDGPVSGGGQPNFRGVPGEDGCKGHAAADDAFAGFRCTACFCQCRQLLRHSLDHWLSRPCPHGDHKNRGVRGSRPAGHE